MRFIFLVPKALIFFPNLNNPRRNRSVSCSFLINSRSIGNCLFSEQLSLSMAKLGHYDHNVPQTFEV